MLLKPKSNWPLTTPGALFAPPWTGVIFAEMPFLAKKPCDTARWTGAVSTMESAPISMLSGPSPPALAPSSPHAVRVRRSAAVAARAARKRYTREP